MNTLEEEEGREEGGRREGGGREEGKEEGGREEEEKGKGVEQEKWLKEKEVLIYGSESANVTKLTVSRAWKAKYIHR